VARARNIKPGFFRNADLVELSFEARLLFIGLWTIADREGRLEDRPKQIKMELFPADNMDCDAMLAQLAAINMIERYEHDGKRYIQVVSFAKHQNPHRDEKASTLPDRDGNVATPKTASIKHGASTVQTPGEQQDDTVAIGLNPESCSLIPESQTEDIAKTGSADSSPPPPPPADANGVQTSQPLPYACPHQDIIDLYHAVLPMGRRVRDWTPARAQHLKTRWREDKKRQALAWWEKFFHYVGQSAFLTGKTQSQNRRPFELSLDWLVKSENFVKTLEGAYHEAEVPA